VNIALIGCGTVGAKRAQHLAGVRLAHCVDLDPQRAAQVAAVGRECACGSDWREPLARADIDAVIVATPPDVQAHIVRDAITAGKHVLVEKPAARNAQELAGLPQLAAQYGVCVRVGFNHRYHPALTKAREIFESGVMGELIATTTRPWSGSRNDTATPLHTPKRAASLRKSRHNGSSLNSAASQTNGTLRFQVCVTRGSTSM